MPLSYKDKYQRLLKEHNSLNRDVKVLLNHLTRIKKKCSDNNLWLMGSCNPHLPLVDDQQQGPMVTKLFDLANKLKDKM